MRNKLGILSLIISVMPWMLIFFFFANIEWYTSTIEDVAGGPLKASFFIGIFLILVIASLILAVRALVIKEFKVYPVISLIFLSPILLFLYFYVSSFRFII